MPSRTTSFENKTSHGNIPWLVGLERTDVLAVMMQAKTQSGCYQLNKNATDMGTSVAQVSNQKIWLNCCAETRP